MQEAVKNTFTDLIITSNAVEEDGTIITPYKFEETALTEMVKKGTINTIVDRIIDRWAQYTFFIDAFIGRAISFLRITRLIVRFSKSHIHDTADELRLTPKAKRFLSADAVVS